MITTSGCAVSLKEIGQKYDCILTQIILESQQHNTIQIKLPFFAFGSCRTAHSLCGGQVVYFENLQKRTIQRLVGQFSHQGLDAEPNVTAFN